MSTDEGNQRAILLVEEDEEMRPILRRNLESEGYRVLLALDERDANERVSGGRINADLILVNLVGVQPDEALHAGRRIRQNAELDVPLVVMAEKYGDELEGKNMKVGENDWIIYLEAHQQLRDLLVELMSKNDL